MGQGISKIQASTGYFFYHDGSKVYQWKDDVGIVGYQESQVEYFVWEVMRYGEKKEEQFFLAGWAGLYQAR